MDSDQYIFLGSDTSKMATASGSVTILATSNARIRLLPRVCETQKAHSNLQVRKGAKRSAPPLKPQRSWVDTPKEEKGRDLS